MPRRPLPSPTARIGKTRTLAIGAVLFAIGSFLVWDATERRGHNLPWPASAIAPW